VIRGVNDFGREEAVKETLERDRKHGRDKKNGQKWMQMAVGQKKTKTSL
jgi:hypothetical protein